MKYLAATLGVGVLYRHAAHNFLPGLSDRAWFYINGGLWEITLCLLIASFLWAAKRDRWTKLGIVACGIGALEGFQMSACMMAIGGSLKGVQGNLCDHITGMPVGATMMGIYLIIICWAIKK